MKYKIGDIVICTFNGINDRLYNKIGIVFGTIPSTARPVYKVLFGDNKECISEKWLKLSNDIQV